MLRVWVWVLSTTAVCGLVRYGGPAPPGLNIVSLEDQLDREEDR